MTAAQLFTDYQTKKRFEALTNDSVLWEQMAFPFPELTCPTEATLVVSVKKPSSFSMRIIGLWILAFALGGIVGPVMLPTRLEASYLLSSFQEKQKKAEEPPLPPSAAVIYDPLMGSDGNQIVPADQNFSIIIPKIGVNARVIPAVDPGNTKAYEEALKAGVAHASTSFFPNEDGTVYLFSHSTNYDWFVKDLNAVFYLLKNLDSGDQIILVYKGTIYTYQLQEKRVVKPSEISFMAPIPGEKRLILQTCWPPGSTTERLLIFANLIDTQALTN